jgi:hypothetical protein
MGSPLATGSRLGLGHLPSPMRLAMFVLLVGSAFQAGALTNGVDCAPRCARTGLGVSASGSAHRQARGNFKRSGLAPDAVIEPDTGAVGAACRSAHGPVPQAAIAVPGFAAPRGLAAAAAVLPLSDTRPRFVPTATGYGRPPPTA